MRLKVLLALAAVSCMIVPRIEAEQCQNSDLNGHYSFLVSGTFQGQPFAASGQTLYHGDGTAEGVIQASVGGEILPVASWTATYSLSQMKTDTGGTVCVLTKTITVKDYGPLTISFFGSAGDDFKELRFITTDSGTTISGTARKQ